MPFGIYVMPSEVRDLVEISEADFARLRSAKRNLMVLQSVEEKLTLLLENYAEFETTLLAQTVHNVVYQVTGWSAAVDLISTINRRLVNLLTAGRLYLDHIMHDLGSMYGTESEVGIRVKEETGRQYDGSLGYRAMEALRNYVQHRGLPVEAVRHVIRANGAPPGYAANIVTPYLSTKAIKEDGGFKRPVLDELLAVGELVDLKPLIRAYIEGIQEVHKTFRRSVAADAAQWELILRSAMEQRREPGEQLPTLFVVEVDEELKILQEVQVFEDLLNRRQQLEQRTPLYGNLSKQIVTSEAVDIRQDDGHSDD